MKEAIVLIVAFSGLFALAWVQRKEAEEEYADFKRRNFPYGRLGRQLFRVGSHLRQVGYALGAAIAAIGVSAVQAANEMAKAMRSIQEAIEEEKNGR